MGRALTHRFDVAAGHHECVGFQTLLALEGLVAGLVASKRVIDLLTSLRAAVLAIGDKFIAADMCGDDVKVITGIFRSEEHTSELQSLMRISYAVFCLKKKKK